MKSNLRNVHGILLLNKPMLLSSNDALQKVKRLLQVKKAGHTGSLDPLATGMLPLCFGEATKFSQFLLDAHKSYEVIARLGVRTTTSDSEGEVVAEKTVPSFTRLQLEESLSSFKGDVEQVPSMYSALKHQGQPLYKLARQGIEVERPSRKISIFTCEITDINGNDISLFIKCSKGTYIRTIVDDWGELLGCGAHVAALHRTEVGPYASDQMIDFSEIEQQAGQARDLFLKKALLPVSSSVHDCSRFDLIPLLAHKIKQGQKIFLPEATVPGLVKLFGSAGEFLGVGEVQSDGWITPRRLVSRSL